MKAFAEFIPIEKQGYFILVVTFEFLFDECCEEFIVFNYKNAGLRFNASLVAINMKSGFG